MVWYGARDKFKYRRKKKLKCGQGKTKKCFSLVKIYNEGQSDTSSYLWAENASNNSQHTACLTWAWCVSVRHVIFMQTLKRVRSQRSSFFSSSLCGSHVSSDQSWDNSVASVMHWSISHHSLHPKCACLCSNPCLCLITMQCFICLFVFSSLSRCSHRDTSLSVIQSWLCSKYFRVLAFQKSHQYPTVINKTPHFTPASRKGY